MMEREKIAIYKAQGLSSGAIAKLLGRHKSTISRELRRNTFNGEYLPSKAQAAYVKRRKKCCPRKKLSDKDLFERVKRNFLDLHMSPEQIAGRLKLEDYPVTISYKTIYRAIYAGMFDTPEQRRSTGNRGARRKLRHKGKPRHPKGYVSNRGKIPISHELSERPIEAKNRERFGDWEADTIVGKNRKSESITSDRGREFQLHGKVTKELGVEFYFPPPHQPWQRGTNENTNGLLREYFPKGYDFNTLSDVDLQAVVDQLNKRPRKCLGYKTPAEVYFSTPLQLV
jgi:IS30 family transposase